MPSSSARDSTARRILREATTARTRDTVLGAVFAVTHHLGEAAVPVIVGMIVGEVLTRGSAVLFAVWLAILAGDFVLLSLSYRFGARARMRARQAGAHRVRLRIVERALDPGGGVDRAPGELLSRAASDADRVGAWASNLGTSVAAVVVVVASTAALLVASPILGATALGGSIGVLVVGRLLFAPVAVRSHEEQAAAAAATSAAEDTVRGIRVLRGIRAGAAAVERYRRVSEAGVVAARRAAGTAAAVGGVGAGLTGLLLVAIAFVGGVLAIEGTMPVAALVASLGLTGFLLGPLRQAAGIPALRARSHASAQRIAELLATRVAVVDPAPAPVPAGAAVLELDGVLPGPPIVAGPGMTGIVVDAEQGRRLAALLARDADPDPGAIRWDGRDVRELGIEAYRSRVVVSPHDAALFDGSVADALTMAGVHPGGFDAVVDAAYLDELIERLPAGMRSSIGEGGSRLSGGERQRVALARALAIDAPVLVLHDPTSAVDAVTEDAIAERLRVLRAGRTTVLLTSSPVLLARCDRVVRVAAAEGLA